MCSIIMNADGLPHKSDLYSDRQMAESFVNNMVNGNFLRTTCQMNCFEKATVCVSTICALCKEFNLDWINEDLASKSQAEQRDFMAAFGAYLEIPLRTLSDLLKRIRYVGRRKAVKGFQYQLDIFWDAVGLRNCTPPLCQSKENLTYDPRVVLLVYMATALSCHRLWQMRQDVYKPIPWTIGSDRAGRHVTLRYHFWTGAPRRVKKSHFDYVLRIALPAITVAGLRKLNNDVIKRMRYGKGN